MAVSTARLLERRTRYGVSPPTVCVRYDKNKSALQQLDEYMHTRYHMNIISGRSLVFYRSSSLSSDLSEL